RTGRRRTPWKTSRSCGSWRASSTCAARSTAGRAGAVQVAPRVLRLARRVRASRVVLARGDRSFEAAAERVARDARHDAGRPVRVLRARGGADAEPGRAGVARDGVHGGPDVRPADAPR